MASSSSQQPLTISESRAVMADAMNKALEVFCLLKEKTFDEVMASAIQPIAQALNIDRILIYRNVKKGEEYRPHQLYSWDRINGGFTITGVVELPATPATTVWLSDHMKGYCVSRQITAATEDEILVMNANGIKSFFSVPVFTRGEYWGSVVFQDTSTELMFSEDCMDLVLSFARLCAKAIISDETERKLAEAEERTRVMLDATPLCCQLWTRDFQIIDCNETAVELFGFKSKNEFMSGFTDTSPKYQPDGQLSLHKGRMFVVKAFEEGRSFMDWTHRLQDGTLMPVEVTMVRVLYKGEFVVAGFTRDLRQIKKMESSILRLEAESETVYFDPLTSIFNRRFFDENLSRVMKTLSRSGGVLSMLMVDIDFFKDYNNAYGHSTGDQCLRIVATSLTKSVTRADDFVVRYSGEEFAVVLPNTDEEGARLLADNMLENIRSCNISHEKSSAADIVTVSIGVTTGLVQSNSRADDFIIRADELLYMSKLNGRNRSTFGRL